VPLRSRALLLRSSESFYVGCSISRDVYSVCLVVLRLPVVSLTLVGLVSLADSSSRSKALSHPHHPPSACISLLARLLFFTCTTSFSTFTLAAQTLLFIIAHRLQTSTPLHRSRSMRPHQGHTFINPLHRYPNRSNTFANLSTGPKPSTASTSSQIFTPTPTLNRSAQLSSSRSRSLSTSYSYLRTSKSNSPTSQSSSSNVAKFYVSTVQCSYSPSSNGLSSMAPKVPTFLGSKLLCSSVIRQLISQSSQYCQSVSQVSHVSQSSQVSQVKSSLVHRQFP